MSRSEKGYPFAGGYPFIDNRPSICGEGGIRTLGQDFARHTLSRRAQSATLSPLLPHSCRADLKYKLKRTSEQATDRIGVRLLTIGSFQAIDSVCRK